MCISTFLGSQLFVFPPEDKEGGRLLVREKERIDAVVPGDFNWDGKLDVLVIGPSLSPEAPVDAMRLHLYLGHFTRFEPEPIVLPDSIGQPLVLDANGDFVPDLFGVAASTGKRSFWLGQLQPGAKAVSYTIVQQALEDGGLPQLALPHSNAVVDMDGDCAGDLLVTSQDPNTGTRFLEIWLYQNGQSGRGGPQFAFHRAYQLPNGTGQLSYADFDGDGNIDVLFPVCWPAGSCSQDNSIHIIYNQQFSSRKDTALCASLPFSLDPFVLSPSRSPSSSSSAAGSAGHVVIGPSAFGQSILLDAGPGIPPLMLRTGDVNLDGYPDILVPLRRLDLGTTLVSLWLNVPCDAQTCGQEAVNEGRRMFARASEKMEALESVQGAVAAAFFDIQDDGSLDVLVLHYPSPTSALPSVTAVLNDFEEDAYFLTTLVSNGVCNAWCPADQFGSKFPSPKPYGVNQPGAVVKFTVTDVSGRKLQRTGVQLPQSAYLSLGLPYSVHGLGRTNNYIELFYVGLATDYGKYYNSWVAQIPNSQLVCFPWPRHSPVDWTLELLISPSTRLLKVALSLLGTLVALGATIGLLHWREKKQDEAESKHTSHLFVF